MTPQGPNLRLKGFTGYAGSGLRGYAGSGFGDVPDDWATPEQRDRLTFLADQLHAMGLSLGQAQARGDDATVATLRRLIAKARHEQQTLQEAIVRQSNAGQTAAESGAYATPVEKFLANVKDTLKIGGLAAALGLGVVAYLMFRPR